MNAYKGNDPVEKVIAAALNKADIAYHSPCPYSGLDFYLPKLKVHIECKRFHSDRISEQMARVGDVIAIQGLHAASIFAAMIEGNVK